jgi:hypothetical protein
LYIILACCSSKNPAGMDYSRVFDELDVLNLLAATAVMQSAFGKSSEQITSNMCGCQE